ncbi:RING-H2 finger protein [Musa troglodytarum]|uniref:RING-type E3 ubiquitin transferase n=1 Tax=Musa troglodytarum TaxID=320322 RepID=A0A9E7JCD1_9LILI|nr:RING-H2 finger protein [Musa troglodytarum]
MKPGNRRLLPNGSSPTPPPLPAVLGKPAAQLYSSSNSMAVTALIILLALFFFGFFSVYAHRFVSGLRRSEARRWRARQQAARQQRGSRFEAACGLDPSAVLALPVLRYVGAGEGAGKEGCVVCLGKFEEKERVKVIPRCGHVFHPSCIDAWLVSRGSCPICRCSDVIASCSTSSVLGLEAQGAAAEEAEGGGVPAAHLQLVTERMLLFLLLWWWWWSSKRLPMTAESIIICRRCYRNPSPALKSLCNKSNLRPMWTSYF